jgi:hypothetical protein
MSYLARLETLLAEKRSPEELTELTKGASVGFVSDQGSSTCGDEAATEDRAEIAADSIRTGNGERPCFVCGQPTSFGFGVRLLEGREGQWTCAAHRPHGEGRA